MTLGGVIMYKADYINFRAGEVLAWFNNGIRYAIVKKNGKFYDQKGREIKTAILKAAIEAAME